MAGVTNQRSLVELLQLEEKGERTFVAPYVFPEAHKMFGGQLAAQALRAAGLTCSDQRIPHSFHGYFLRPGDTERPTEYHVEVEREGRRFSSRRVTALQRDQPIYRMTASFHLSEGGPSNQSPSAPAAIPPEEGRKWMPARLFSVDGRSAAQKTSADRTPTRFWIRCREEELVLSPLWNACVLAYCADSTNAVNHFATSTHRASTSLDYAVWFHRLFRAADWMLVDLAPQIVARGRGFYRGAIYQQDGQLIASVAQETLFHERES